MINNEMKFLIRAKIKKTFYFFLSVRKGYSICIQHTDMAMTFVAIGYHSGYL